MIIKKKFTGNQFTLRWEKKTTAKKKTARKPKKVYYCVPCGAEVTITREGMGVTRLMCCGQVMKQKTARQRAC